MARTEVGSLPTIVGGLRPDGHQPPPRLVFAACLAVAGGCPQGWCSTRGVCLWSVRSAGRPSSKHRALPWAVASCKLAELTPALLSSCSHHVLPPRQPAVQHYLGVLHGGGVPDHGRVQYVSAAWPWKLGGLWGHDPAAALPPLRPSHGPCEVSRWQGAFLSTALLFSRGPGPGRETGREPGQGRDMTMWTLLGRGCQELA